MDRLSVASIQDGLETTLVGRNLIYLPITDSTNSQARQLAEQGAPAGTVVVAEYQTAGRGRLGRRWESPPGGSLLLSLVFRPSLAPDQLQRLTMICSLAVADAVQAQTGLPVALKWPNDLIVGGAKVGGVLTEAGWKGGRVEYAVVGIGLNVNLDPAQLPGKLLMPAASLSHALGQPVARLPLLRAILREIEDRYMALWAGFSPYREWGRKLVTIGQAVLVAQADGFLQGVAVGVNADGALLVRRADGQIETVVAGDVTLWAQSGSIVSSQ